MNVVCGGWSGDDGREGPRLHEQSGVKDGLTRSGNHSQLPPPPSPPSSLSSLTSLSSSSSSSSITEGKTLFYLTKRARGTGVRERECVWWGKVIFILLFFSGGEIKFKKLRNKRVDQGFMNMLDD